jgi:putative FmdB family regulatory protein
MVGERKILCKKCRNIFEFSGTLNQGKILCPECGSLEIEDSPVWAPLGSGRNIFDSPMWEYECQNCKRKFQMPIPASPTEDKMRTCPACGSGHLHRLTAADGAPLYCG